VKTRLELPSPRFGESYIALVEEFRERGEPYVPFTLKYSTDDFGAFLARLKACSEGAEIANGFVAHTTYWLVGDDQHVIGVSNLRHDLTDSLRREGGHIGYGIRPTMRRRGYATRILAETLLKAKALGIARALVTCDKGNVGSARTILKNGGVFHSEERLPGHEDIKQRYWISLGNG
jgi:predicted acetyltransferase